MNGGSGGGVTPKRSGTPEERRAYFREQKKRWRDNNPEKSRAARNQWRLNNIDKARVQSREGNRRYRAKLSPDKREEMRQYFQEYGKANRNKIRIYHQSWVEKNRDKARSYVNNYDRTNREKRKSDARKRRLANTVHVRLIEHKWRKENIESLRQKERTRATAVGTYDTEKVMMRIALFGGVCAYCGGPFEHLDHAIAIARGGSNWPANFRPACKACNLSKGARGWRKWPVLF